jgi:hypothetical protein
MSTLSIKVERNAAVFVLPWIIAQERGYFAAEDVDVELIPTGSYMLTADRPVADHREVSPLAGQQAYTTGEVGVFQA